MKTTNKKSRHGFTLIEILVVITIIAILAGIMVPLAGKARETALKRRAATEMQSIKMAVLQFYQDHRYMPWEGDPKVGPDMWTTAADGSQVPVMLLLTGDNPMQKTYLQIPEKSRKLTDAEDPIPMRFLDPWGQHYLIGMDRNLDGAVTVSGSNVPEWEGQTVMEKVLVISEGHGEPMKTFDILTP